MLEYDFAIKCSNHLYIHRSAQQKHIHKNTISIHFLSQTLFQTILKTMFFFSQLHTISVTVHNVPSSQSQHQVTPSNGVPSFWCTNCRVLCITSTWSKFITIDEVVGRDESTNKFDVENYWRLPKKTNKYTPKNNSQQVTLFFETSDYEHSFPQTPPKHTSLFVVASRFFLEGATFPKHVGPILGRFVSIGRPVTHISWSLKPSPSISQSWANLLGFTHRARKRHT